MSVNTNYNQRSIEKQGGIGVGPLEIAQTPIGENSQYVLELEHALDRIETSCNELEVKMWQYLQQDCNGAANCASNKRQSSCDFGTRLLYLLEKVNVIEAKIEILRERVIT